MGVRGSDTAVPITAPGRAVSEPVLIGQHDPAAPSVHSCYCVRSSVGIGAPEIAGAEVSDVMPGAGVSGSGWPTVLVVEHGRRVQYRQAHWSPLSRRAMPLGQLVDSFWNAEPASEVPRVAVVAARKPSGDADSSQAASNTSNDTCAAVRTATAPA